MGTNGIAPTTNNGDHDPPSLLGEILNDALADDLRGFIGDTFERLSDRDETMADEFEERLYARVYGNHFNRWTLSEALSEMRNEDGSTGGHWTVEETNRFKPEGRFNEYDWNYVMNMIYSDYYGIVGNTESIVGLARRFILDSDAPEGKAYRYYVAMN